MIDLIVALFFGKTVLLTHQPVDVTPTYELKLEHPISAVTDGATLRFEVPIGSFSSGGRIDEVQRAAATAFPPGAISARVSERNGKRSFDFTYNGRMGQSGSMVWLFLESSEEVPARVEFDRITVQTKSTLRQVKLYWRNCKQIGG